MKIRFIRYFAFLAAFVAFSCSKNPSGDDDSVLPLLFSAETDDLQMKSGAGANSIITTGDNLIRTCIRLGVWSIMMSILNCGFGAPLQAISIPIISTVSRIL